MSTGWPDGLPVKGNSACVHMLGVWADLLVPGFLGCVLPVGSPYVHCSWELLWDLTLGTCSLWVLVLLDASEGLAGETHCCPLFFHAI